MYRGGKDCSRYISRFLQAQTRHSGKAYIRIEKEEDINGGGYWQGLSEASGPETETFIGDDSVTVNEIVSNTRGIDKTGAGDGRDSNGNQTTEPFSWFEQCFRRDQQEITPQSRVVHDLNQMQIISVNGVESIFYQGTDTTYTERLCKRLVDGIQKRDFVSDIIFFRNMDELKRIHNILRTDKRGSSTALLIWGVHYEGEDNTRGHIHVYHDCNKNRGTCRCWFIHEIIGNGFVRRHEGKKPAGRVTWIDLMRILIYLCQGRRYIAGIRIGNRREAIPSKSALLSATGFDRNSDIGAVEELSGSHELLFRRQFSGASTSDRPVSGRKGRSRSYEWQDVRGKKEIKTDFERLTEFVESHFVVPIDALVRCSFYNTSEWKDRRAGDNLLKRVADHVITKLLPCTLKELEDFWNNQQGELYWQTKEYKSQGLICYDLNTSVLKAEEFLNFQYNYDQEQICEFLSFTSKWLNRLTGKMNTIEIVADASSGKNWFFDPIQIFMTSFGMIGNMSKTNNFPWEGCHNKRILVFNEPIFENRFYEELKIVMGGSPFMAQAKYCSNMEIMKTPILVMCNASRFPNKREWKERIFRIRWGVPDDVSYMSMRLDPRFFIHLCKKYNIVYE